MKYLALSFTNISVILMLIRLNKEQTLQIAITMEICNLKLFIVMRTRIKLGLVNLFEKETSLYTGI